MKINHLIALTLIVTVAPLARAQEAADPNLQTKAKAAKEKKTKAEAQAKAKEEQAKAEVAARKLKEPFWKRFDEAMLEQLGTPAYVPGTPPPVRRIPPPPFDSPPFPTADWQIGGQAGTAIIGDPGELSPYPLMQAIYDGPGGQAWNDSKVQIYGWVNFSGNIVHRIHPRQARTETSRWFTTFVPTAWN